ATAASTALPPFFRIASPTSLAGGDTDTTMPPFAAFFASARHSPLTPQPPLPPRGEGESEFLLPLSPWWERGLGGEGANSAASASRPASGTIFDMTDPSNAR